MKKSIHAFLMSIAVVCLLFGCEATEPAVDPLIQPQFEVTVSGQSWKPHRGGALVLNGEDYGAISIRMAGPNDGNGRTFRLAIENINFEWLPVTAYSISSLSDGFVENAQYEQKDSSGATEQWRSERLNAAEINVSSISEVDGLLYLSGNFRASPCNGDLFPACIPIVGSFENLRLFYDAEVMVLLIGSF